MALQVRQDVVPQPRSFPQGRQHIGHHIVPAHVFVLRQPPPLVCRHLQPKHLPGGQHRGGHIRGYEVLHNCFRAARHRVIALGPGHLRALRRDRYAVQGKPLELAAGNRAHIAAGAGLQGKAVDDPPKGAVHQKQPPAGEPVLMAAPQRHGQGEAARRPMPLNQRYVGGRQNQPQRSEGGSLYSGRVINAYLRHAHTPRLGIRYRRYATGVSSGWSLVMATWFRPGRRAQGTLSRLIQWETSSCIW